MLALRLKLASAVLVPAAIAAAHTARPGDAAAAAQPLASAAAVRVAHRPVAARVDERMPARGIDVSHHQGRIDWAAVQGEGVGFAFVKATEGATFTDPAFARNWAALGETPIARGAYHRFRPRADAVAQARHFVAVARISEGDLPPVVDVEATDGVGDARLVRGVRAWLAEVERETGKRPIVYTKPGFRRAHLGSAVDDYPLWIAEYGVDQPSAGAWTFWQHSERGRVAGIGTAVDLDRFNGSMGEMRRFALEGGGGTALAER